MLRKSLSIEKIVDAEDYLSDPTLYNTRFIILLVLCLSLFSNGEAWMTFGTVTSQSMTYFQRSEEDITWFGNVFLLTYAIEAVPCTFMPQLIGLKWTIIVGCALNLGGILFRLASMIMPDNIRFNNFLIAMIGNAIFGLAQGFMLNIPAMVSSRWFGTRERAISTSLAYMSNAVGVGIGFLDIFIIMGEKNTDDHISSSFRLLFIAEAVLIVITFILAIIFVKESPQTPPSRSELKKLKHVENFYFFSSIRRMLGEMLKVLTKRDSCLALYIYSIYYGMYVCIYIYLSLIITSFVKDTTNIAGYIGSVGVILAGISSVIIGIIMDKTGNKYNRHIGFFINLFCFLPILVIMVIILTGTLNNIEAMILFLVYLNFCAVYVATGSEILADVTYPIDPNVAINEGLVFGNIIGVMLTYVFGLIPKNVQCFALLGTGLIAYASNCILLIFFKFEQNRQSIERIQYLHEK